MSPMSSFLVYIPKMKSLEVFGLPQKLWGYGFLLAFLNIDTWVYASERGPALPPLSFNLSSLRWTLSSANGSISIQTPFINQVQLALMEAGLLPDQNVGLNVTATNWVSDEESWTWSTEFGHAWTKVAGSWTAVEEVSKLL